MSAHNDEWTLVCLRERLLYRSLDMQVYRVATATAITSNLNRCVLPVGLHSALHIPPSNLTSGNVQVISSTTYQQFADSRPGLLADQKKEIASSEVCGYCIRRTYANHTRRNNLSSSEGPKSVPTVVGQGLALCLTARRLVPFEEVALDRQDNGQHIDNLRRDDSGFVPVVPTTSQECRLT